MLLSKAVYKVTFCYNLGGTRIKILIKRELYWPFKLPLTIMSTILFYIFLSYKTNWCNCSCCFMRRIVLYFCIINPALQWTSTWWTESLGNRMVIMVHHFFFKLKYKWETYRNLILPYSPIYLQSFYIKYIWSRIHHLFYTLK